MNRRLLVLVFAGVLMAGGTAYAHHSLAATYHADQEVKLEGKIIDFLFRNPHSFLQIEAPDEKGVMQRWSLEWRSSGQLGQQGIKRDTLKVGDEIVVTINPSRTPADHRGALKTLRRKSDGFGWGNNPGIRVNRRWLSAAISRGLFAFSAIALQNGIAQVPFNPSAAPPRPAGRGPALPPKQAAPIDMTGYWVSVVTEDWRFRMVTPPKGNYGGVPLNAAGRKLADAWDPAKDEAEGNQCRSYGAPALMRVPGRLHVTWDNDTTLKIEADAGKQTRVFHFGGNDAQAQASMQGYSAAQWEAATTPKGQPRAGDLKVVTTHMAPGYLRKNGVPYSANTMLTEYYDRISDPSGEWLVVTTEVRDPNYLRSTFVTSTHFKKQADAEGWMPEACSSR